MHIKTPQQNAEALAVARAELKAHCMALKVTEERERILIVFPRGYSVDGAQCRFKAQGMSKTEAYRALLKTAERVWQQG